MRLRLIEFQQFFFFQIRINKVVIVVFQDSVSKETIEKYAADVVANGTGHFILVSKLVESWYIDINPSFIE